MHKSWFTHASAFKIKLKNERKTFKRIFTKKKKNEKLLYNDKNHGLLIAIKIQVATAAVTVAVTAIATEYKGNNIKKQKNKKKKEKDQFSTFGCRVKKKNTFVAPFKNTQTHTKENGDNFKCFILSILTIRAEELKMEKGV